MEITLIFESVSIRPFEKQCYIMLQLLFMFKFLLLTFIGLQLSVSLAAQHQLHHTASGKIIDTYLGEVDSNVLLGRINEKFLYRIFANSPDTLLVNYISYNNNGQLKENIEGEDIENDFVESFRGYSYINENTFQVKEIFNIPTYSIYKNRFLKKRPSAGQALGIGRKVNRKNCLLSQHPF